MNKTRDYPILQREGENPRVKALTWFAGERMDSDLAF